MNRVLAHADAVTELGGRHPEGGPDGSKPAAARRLKVDLQQRILLGSTIDLVALDAPTKFLGGFLEMACIGYTLSSHG